MSAVALTAWHRFPQGSLAAVVVALMLASPVDFCMAAAPAAPEATTAMVATAATGGMAGPPPGLAAREYRLAHELRCVVCQNQSLAESNAPLAADMRAVIREQLVAGRTDAEVVAFFEQRYGAFVSYTPPWRPSTWLLWAGPFCIALLGLALLARALKRHESVAPPLSATTERDEERLRQFLEPAPLEKAPHHE